MEKSQPENKIQRLTAAESSDTSDDARRFRDFFDYSLALFCTHDFRGSLLSINPAAAAALGYESEQLIGRNLAEFLSPEELGFLPEYLKRIETNGKARGMMKVVMRGGETRVWSYSNVRQIDAGGEYYVLGCAQDVTELKRNEKELKAARDAALESARLKSAFLTNVSHEIRTPMNGVIGMTELLLDTPLDRVQRDYAETIRQSSDALLTVLNDILDLAKIESGKLRFESIDFDVRDVVESTVEMFAERAYRKNIEIASLVAPGIPQLLSSDPGRLRQVLTNLISNAVKFTERGEIGVWVETESESEKNITLRFTVTDTGIGIRREDLKNLFQPFVQADDSMTRRFGGTGLGLAISKQIVEIMNGQITVESQPDSGSKFSFTARFAKTFVFKSRQEKINLARLLKGKKILIADSSPIIRRTLGEYCRAWEMTAAEASTGEKVLERLTAATESEKPFDLVVIDMNLSDWEGFSLARKIKSDKSFYRTEVILTTVYGQRGDGATAHKIGVAAYLTKPVRGAQLFDCLTTVLRENRKPSAKDETAEQNLVTRHSLREAKTLEMTALLLFRDKHFPVLVVEDNEINRHLVIKQLEQIGIVPDVAIDGVEALEKIEAKDYRLVLMDCQMPRLDGYETTREIRRREKARADAEKDFSPLAIIALTAHTLAGEREKCLAAGMDDYLSKPIKIKDLFALIQYWCGADETNFELDLKPPETERQILGFLASEAENKDFAEEINALYLAETETRFDELKQAAAALDGEKIARIAHAVRGNSLAVGAVSIAQTAENIQELARQNNYQEIKRELSRFNEEFSALQKRLPVNSINS